MGYQGVVVRAYETDGAPGLLPLPLTGPCRNWKSAPPSAGGIAGAAGTAQPERPQVHGVPRGNLLSAPRARQGKGKRTRGRTRGTQHPWKERGTAGRAGKAAKAAVAPARSSLLLAPPQTPRPPPSSPPNPRIKPALPCPQSGLSVCASARRASECWGPPGWTPLRDRLSPREVLESKRPESGARVGAGGWLGGMPRLARERR